MTSLSPDSSPAAAHPFSALTPDAVLDALDSVGLYGDGRLLALSSYENRVYQVALEDGTRVVAKFYRPGRWSTAHILEEHAFATELAVAEVPVVAPLLLQGATLHQHAGFAFSVSPWRGGRLPELDDFEVLEWLGRFIARLHCVGAERNFQVRPALDLHRKFASFFIAACAYPARLRGRVDPFFQPYTALPGPPRPAWGRLWVPRQARGLVFQDVFGLSAL